MRTTGLTILSLVLWVQTASAQFFYLVSDVSPAEQFFLVFNSGPLTGVKCDAEKLRVRSLSAIDPDGKRTAIPLVTTDTDGLVAKTPADTLFASVDYGVSNRGEGQAVLLRYHAKCQPVGGKGLGLPLEVTPKAVTGGVAFVITAGGKPLGNGSVMLHEPGDTDPRAVATDADGLTPTYSKGGRYAVRVGRFEKGKGEHDGKAYTGIWEYSTLVTVVK
jgi:hypothetical protein